MNKVQLHGFCGKDPEVKTLESGKKVAKFTFATSESYKDSAGVKQTHTEWHSIVVWDKLSDLCEKYVKKGSEFILEGKISYRDYTDKDGVKKYFTEIICNGIEFCGKKESENKPDDKQGEYQKSGKVEVKSMSNPDDLPGANIAPENDELSNLPF
jgi:single-strand DNA-binding protein